MIFTSDIIECDVPNKNGHIYPKKCMEDAFNDPIIKEQMNNNIFFGTYADFYDDAAIGTIDVSKVSHVLKAIEWEENRLFGTFETLNTPYGKNLCRILENDPYINKSDCMTIAGTGNLRFDPKTGNAVVENYKLSSVNFTMQKA